MRTVLPKPNKKVSKIYDQMLHSLKQCLRKKAFRVERRTSIYLCHRLLFEFPENLKLFGHVLYNTDDYTYVESAQNVLSFSHWAHHFLVFSAKCTSLYETDVFSPRSKRFVIFALGELPFRDFQRSARVCTKQCFQAKISRFGHFRTGRTTS